MKQDLEDESENDNRDKINEIESLFLILDLIQNLKLYS